MVKGVTAIQERRYRIQQLRDIITKTFKSGKNIDKEKLIAVCSLDFGLSRRKVLEYLRELKVFIGFIEVNGILKKGEQKKLSIDAE